MNPEIMFAAFVEDIKQETGWDGKENLKLVNRHGHAIGTIKQLFEIMSWECLEGKDNIKDVVGRIE